MVILNLGWYTPKGNGDYERQGGHYVNALGIAEDTKKQSYLIFADPHDAKIHVRPTETLNAGSLVMKEGNHGDEPVNPEIKATGFTKLQNEFYWKPQNYRAIIDSMIDFNIPKALESKRKFDLTA